MYTIGDEFANEFKQLITDTPLELKKLNGIAELDPFKLANAYYNIDNVASMSIDPNANITGKSPVNFQSEIFKPIMKVRSMYTAWNLIKEEHGLLIANECIKACLNGKLYHHDWVKYDVPYCFAVDTSFWMHEGRPYGWLPGGIPRKLQSYIGQTVEVAMDLSQEHAGAIALANVLVNAAYYSYKDRQQIKKAVEKFNDIINFYAEDYEESLFDTLLEALVRLYSHNDDDFAKKISYICEKEFTLEEAAMYLYDKYVEDLLQHLVHVLHNTFRVGGDSPFTNISLFCRETIKATFAEAIYPDFSKPTDIIDEIMHIQEIFAKFFSEGSPITKKNYRFPVCTVNIATKPRAEFTCDELKEYPQKKFLIKDREFVQLIGKYNAKRGVFNIHQGTKLASCCRLSQSLEELKNLIRADTFGNGGMSLGSHRVVALGLHSIACEAEITGDNFYTVLLKYSKYAEYLLVAHKKWMNTIINTGTLKFFGIKWEDPSMFFSTFGFVGLWDAYHVLTHNEKVDLDKYKQFACGTIEFIEGYAQKASRQNEGFAFNVEEVPAENAAPKLAQMDNFLYKDYSWYESVHLLSNQMIPLYEQSIEAFDRLELMGYLMDKVSGGAICHFPVGGSMTEEASVRLTEVMIEDYGIVHFAIEIGTTTCVNGHTSIGIHQKCPICDGNIDTWTRRVVGFNSDTKDWTEIRRDWENQRRIIYAID